jgi:hypothetical protein
MSLEACPVCGYAVCSETLQCRHCPPQGNVRTASTLWINALGFAAAIAGAIYFLFFR